MKLNPKTPEEKAAVKYAEKQFESTYEKLTIDQVKADFKHCVNDFIAGYKFYQSKRKCINYKYNVFNEKTTG